MTTSKFTGLAMALRQAQAGTLIPFQPWAVFRQPRGAV
jgi:hypothetical protein